MLSQSYLSSELLFLPKLPLDVLRVLQGLVEMPLPPVLYVLPLFLAYTALGELATQTCGVVTWVPLILSLPLDSDVVS